MSETEKKNSWWRKLLRCPAVWLAFFWCLLAFVFVPLLEHPEMFYSRLPASLYDAWEEFAVLHFEGWIAIAGLFFFLFSLALALVTPFSGEIRGWKKTGRTLLYLFFVFLWLLFAIPLAGRARERAKRICCISNLKQMYMALEQYAGDSEGFLPPDLKTLQESGYLTDFEVFRCPSRLRPNAEFSDYLYFGRDRKLKDPPFLLVRDRDKNHPGGYWNNLFSDRQVRPEPEVLEP